MIVANMVFSLSGAALILALIFYVRIKEYTNGAKPKSREKVRAG